MKAAWIVLNLLPLLLLAGCSESGQQAASDADSPKPQHVWQEQVETLDKAQQVEQTLIDAQRRRDQQLRGNTQ